MSSLPRADRKPPTPTTDASPPDPVLPEGPPSVTRRVLGVALTGAQRYGAVYVLIVIVILFSVLKPGIFPTLTTVKSVLNSNAILALVSLSLVIPLACGVFDLSIGAIVAFSTVFLTALAVTDGIPVGLAIAITIVASLLFGVINGVVVVTLGIDSFIATLGTSAVIQALNYLISNDIPISSAPFSQSISGLAQTSAGGIQLPVFIALVAAVAIWWTLKYTVTGRRMFATGFNEEAARLAGVRTKRLQFIALLTSAVTAGVAGVLVTASVGSSSPDVGNTYLLSAFAAAFLGATQVERGRFNALGTVIAVIVLGTGTAGLTIVGAGQWAQQLYTGVVLIVSLALTRLDRRQLAAGRNP
jgi:ribose/xylose/arabinose/galactoside ABC-type transport system permease subunit